MPIGQSLEKLSEKQLVQLAQKGDAQAFARLYETHKRRVYAICLRITRDTAEAEDCVQEAFLQCFLRLSTFRGEAALSTWLYRLTVNVVLMRRREAHVKPVSLDTAGRHEDSGEGALLNVCPVAICGLRARSTASLFTGRCAGCPPATAPSSCYMMWKAKRIVKLRANWAVRSVTRNPNCTRRACAYAAFCGGR